MQLALDQGLAAQVPDRRVLLRADHVEECLPARVFDQDDQVPSLATQQRRARRSEEDDPPSGPLQQRRDPLPVFLVALPPPSGLNASRFSITTGASSSARPEKAANPS